MGHDNILLELESRGHIGQGQGNAVDLTSMLDREQFVFEFFRFRSIHAM